MVVPDGPQRMAAKRDRPPIEILLGAEQGASWRKRLGAAFLDQEAREQVLREIRAGVEALAPGLLGAGPADDLVSAAVSVLVAQAAALARPLARPEPASQAARGV